MSTWEFWIDREDGPDEAAIHCEDPEEVDYFLLHLKKDSIPFEISESKIVILGDYATMLFERMRCMGKIEGLAGAMH